MIDLKKEFDWRIEELSKKFVKGPISKNIDLYCAWMNQHYYLVQNSTRYLALAASKVPYEERSYFREWVHHLDEEMDHDLMVVKDLKAMGKGHDEEIMPITKAIIDSQYRDIERFGTNALLGYALLLEGASCIICDPMADNIEDLLGHKRATTFLRFHAKVDQDHYPEGVAKLEKLSEDQKEIVLENLRVMFRLYNIMLDEIIESCEIKKAPVIGTGKLARFTENQQVM